MSEIYLIRHAQASYLSDNYDNLSSLGIDQSRDLGTRFQQQNTQFARVYIGPLHRHRQTHDFALQQYNFYQNAVQEPTVLSGLVEHQGPQILRKLMPVLQTEDPYIKAWKQKIETYPPSRRKYSLLIFDYFIRKWAAGEFGSANLEPWSDFKTKAYAAYQNIVDSVSPGQKIAIITSGGTIAAILAAVLKIPSGAVAGGLNVVIKNTAVQTILVSAMGTSLQSFNDVSHLPPSRLTLV